MSIRLRVFFFGLFAGLLVAFLSLLARVALDGTFLDAVASLFTFRGLVEIAILLLVTVFPVAVPMTVVGAAIAAHIASARPRWPLLSWLTVGCVGGGLLGALGCVLWFGGLTISPIWKATWNDAPQDMLRYILDRALSGGIAGTAAGGIVGLYCWRELRP